MWRSVSGARAGRYLHQSQYSPAAVIPFSYRFPSHPAGAGCVHCEQQARSHSASPHQSASGERDSERTAHRCCFISVPLLVMNFLKRKKTFPWLVGDDKGAFCGPCKKMYEGREGRAQTSSGGLFVTVPFTNWKKSTGSNAHDNKLLKHQESIAHKSALGVAGQAEKLRQSGNSVLSLLQNASEQQKRENCVILTDFARALYFLVQHEIPHTTCYAPLISLLQACDHSGRIGQWIQAAPDNGNYMSPPIATELLVSFSKFISNNIKEIIAQSANLAIMADEATDVRGRQELSICCRFVGTDGLAKETFLGLVQLESTTAEAITEKLVEIIKAFDINPMNIKWLAFDGAANFAGRKNGVQALLRAKCCPDARYIHCRSHLLNLACVNAAKNLKKVKLLYSTLNSLWRFFHLSPKRAGKLHLIQEMLNDAPQNLVEAGDTRWSSNYRSVKAVTSSLLSIILTLQDIHASGDDLSSEAGGLLLTFQDMNFIRMLFAMREILNPVNILSLQLQSKSINLADLPVKVEATLSSLQAVANDQSAYAPAANAFIAECQHHGLALLGSSDPRLHDDLISPYIEKLSCHIKQRLHSDATSSICVALGIFDPSLFAEGMGYGEKEVAFIATEFSIDPGDCIMEWKVFRNFLRSNADATSNEVLLKLASKKNDLADGFPLLHEMSVRLLCAPLGTASVERSFSTMNRICNRLRQRLSSEHLGAAMVVSIEGPENFQQFEDVVKLWHSQKPRRLPISTNPPKS